MDRVKDISKIKLNKGYVLLRLVMKNSNILTPLTITDGGPQLKYAEVVSFSDDIEGLNIGDIVLDFGSSKVFEWQKNKYCIVPRMMLKFVIEKNNFNGKELKN